MAEDSDLEKTESATPKRLSEARSKGQIPRSRELGMFSVVLGGGATLILMSPTLMQSLMHLVEKGLTFDRTQAFDPTQLASLLFHFSLTSLVTFFPFLLSIFIIALLSPVLIGGWSFSWDALSPNFSRLNPLSGLVRMVSAEGVAELVKALLKTFLIGGVGLWLIWKEKEPLLGLMNEPMRSGIFHTGNLLRVTFYDLIWGLVVIVALDVPFQLWSYYKRLRMTKEEVKQEAKEAEGDPQIKARIRAMQREAARKRMMTEVPKANVVVRNPTHFAVALRYEENSQRAPVVVAKGANLIAERICEIATESKVPILRIPPLARSLYTHTEVGEEIPAGLFNAVAQILAYVYQLKVYFDDTTNTYTRPELPKRVDIPPEFAARELEAEEAIA